MVVKVYFNEKNKLFENIKYLILESPEDESLILLRLPWRPIRRKLAIEEREKLIERFMSIWKFGIFLYDYDGQLEHLQILPTDTLEIFNKNQELGNWTLIFGDKYNLVLAEALTESKLMQMSVSDLLRSTKASCIISSQPDNIEWTIAFADK